MLFSASAFMPGCTETNPSDPVAEVINATDLPDANAHELPPMTGDLAFTWDPDDPAIDWGRSGRA